MPAHGAVTAAANADAGNGAKAAAGADASRATAGTAAKPTPASTSSAGDSTPTETAPVGAAVKRDTAQDGQDRGGAAPSDFAALLAASSHIDATAPTVTVISSTPASTPAESNITDPAASELPGQFLALLSGNWAMPAAADAATAGKPAATGNATTPPIPPAMTQTGSLPFAAALPVTTSATAGTIGEPSAALAALAADALGANTADASPSLDSFATAKPMLPATAANGQPGGQPVAAVLPATISAAGGTTGEPSAALTALAAGALGASAERTGSGPGVGTADAPSLLDNTLTTAAPAAASVRAGALPPTAPLALPADPGAGFDDSFGVRIAWMAGQRIGHAQIRLNPEHVGPIDVRVQLDGNRVSAEFHSAHAEVRQAIETSLPRLREMLGQHGLQLGQADIGQRQSDRRGEPMLGHGHDPAREAELDPRMTASPIRSARGLLDEYA